MGSSRVQWGTMAIRTVTRHAQSGLWTWEGQMGKGSMKRKLVKSEVKCVGPKILTVDDLVM